MTKDGMAGALPRPNPRTLGALPWPHALISAERESLSRRRPDTVVGYDGPPYLQPGPNDHNRDIWSPPEKLRLMGAFVWLSWFSVIHRQYQIWEIQSRFYPCITHNCFRFHFIDGWPVAFVNWAWLGEESDRRVRGRAAQIAPGDWASGDHLWFPEVIAPFGHGADVAWDFADLFQFGGEGVAVFAGPDRMFSHLRHYYFPAPS